jgi:hypothetical protein
LVPVSSCKLYDDLLLLKLHARKAAASAGVRAQRSSLRVRVQVRVQVRATARESAQRQECEGYENATDNLSDFFAKEV